MKPPAKRVVIQVQPLSRSATTQDEQAVADLLALLPDATPNGPFLERVWKGLRGYHRRQYVRTWRWAAGSALAFGVVVGVLTLSLLRSTSRAEMLLVEGGVVTGAAGTSWVPAQPGEPLRAGSRVDGDASGSSLVRLRGVATLLTEPSTRLELERLDGATLLRLMGGTVTLRVTKRPNEHPFAVRVGRYTVTVVGTLFTVAEMPDGHVEVSVAEGAVHVTGAEGEWRVSAGERWSSDTPNQRAAESQTAALGPLLNAALRSEPDRQLSELFQAARVRSPAPQRSSPAPTSAPLAETDTPSKSAQLTVPPVLVREVMVHRIHKSPEPERLAVAEPRSVVERSPPAPLAPEPLTTPPPPMSAQAPVLEHDLYAEALALERQGEHHQAAARLQAALASNVGPRDLELYHLALLRQRHLDDPRGALEALLSYRTSFPTGGLRQEVDVSVIESHLSLRQTDAALTESAAFLSRYPKSERADEMRFMRGDLLRLRGDCAGALAEYHAVSRGPAFEDALYYAAYCLGELGQSDVRTAALRNYLDRFPNGKHARAAREAVGE